MRSLETIKINFEAASKEDLATFAWIARDNTCTVLGASTGSFATSGPFMAEALGG